ncbi:hypothetical protein D3C81_1999890 [compost metagenome]
MIKLVQRGQGFFFERQIFVVAQGMAGKKNRHRLLLRKGNRRENPFVQHLIAPMRAHLRIQRNPEFAQLLQVP